MNFPKIGSLFGGTAPDAKTKALQRGNIARAELAQIVARGNAWSIREDAMAHLATSLREEVTGFWWDDDDDDETPDEPYTISDTGVATVCVHGTLINSALTWWMSYLGYCSTPDLLKTIAAVGADARVKKIVLDVKSPGGQVAGINAVADAIWAIRNKGEKKIVAYAQDACSCAYWLASQCERVFVAVDGCIGCVGTLMVISDWSDYYAKLGIKVERITSDGAEEYKGAGAPGTEITDDQKKDMKRNNNAFQALMSAGIQRGRGWTPEQVTAIADGRWYVGTNGVTLGFADRVLTLDETLTILGGGDDLDAPVPEPISPDDSDDISDDDLTQSRKQTTAERSGEGKQTMDLWEQVMTALKGKSADTNTQATADSGGSTTTAAATPPSGTTNAAAPAQGAGLTDAERDELTALRDKHTARLTAARQSAIVTATARYGQDAAGLERAKRTIGTMTDPDAVIDLENEYKANMPKGIQQGATATRFTQSQQAAAGHEGAVDADKEAREREQLRGMVAATRGNRRPSAASAQGGNK